MKSLCAVVALELQQRIMTTIRTPSTIITWLLVSLGLFVKVGERILESRFKTGSAHGIGAVHEDRAIALSCFA